MPPGKEKKKKVYEQKENRTIVVIAFEHKTSSLAQDVVCGEMSGLHFLGKDKQAFQLEKAACLLPDS